MAFLQQSVAWLSRSVDDVVAVLSAAAGLIWRARHVRIVEHSDGSLRFQAPKGRFKGNGGAEEALPWRDGRFAGPLSAAAQARIDGAQVEIILLESRFLLRPLELPLRAAEFLEGVVRSQIDRLTPWTAADSAFGWSRPQTLPGERISVTVAATAKAGIAPMAAAVAAMHAESVVISMALNGSDNAPRIRVLDLNAGGGRRAQRLRSLVIAAPTALGIGAAAVAGVSFYMGAGLEAQRLEIGKKIAARRVDLISGRGSASEEATAALEQKKRQTPASVIVLDSLSQALPDDTFLTEFHVDGDKLQIAGLTRDAPSLIRIIEQARPFSHATFFAPTTRAPTDNGERFHIEAHIEPHFSAPR